MRKRSIAQILIISILIQSCVGYQKVPVAVQQAVNKGKVKVEFDSGKKTKFKYLKLIDGQYFGVRKGYANEHLWKIDENNSSFYLSKNLFRVWITLNNNTKIKGVLHEVGDSSIWVTDSDLVNATNGSKYSSGNDKGIEYFIGDVKKIKVRSVGQVGRGAARGAIIGFALGSLWFLAADGWIGLAAFMMGITGVTGTLLGTLFSSTKNNFDIYGDLEKFKVCREELSSYAVN